MKPLFKKKREITKGMPSAVVLSILIHAALFLLAGMLVVFTVVHKEEKKFIPPKAVERPKMKLRKPKVKVKKTSKPKPTTRIVTKVNRASMPDIQLPEMSGMSDGLAVGLGGFDMMPDFGEVTIFGGGQSIGNDFVGTFYDLKRDRSGRPTPMSWAKLLEDSKDFIRKGWKPSEFARYYPSPKKLYATTFAVPSMLSSLAPAAFGEEDTLGYFWLVHYKGQLVHSEGLTFRFRGTSDDIMVVGVDGEVVLSACIKTGWVDFSRDITPHWQSDSADSRKHFGFEVGDWITLEPGVPLEMNVIIGEIPGGAFSAMLVVEVQGEEYANNIRGAPVFPIFKTAEVSRDLHETIYANLVEGMVNITNGPVFSDYNTSNRSVAQDSGTVDNPSTADFPSGTTADDEMRTWTSTDGKTMEAGFVTVIADKAVLKDSRGGVKKIPLVQLIGEDREFIELALPPTFNIEFSKQSNQRMVTPSPESPSWPVPKILDYVFSTSLKQSSAGLYNHELKVEFFAIGEEIDGDNYILLDRQESRFTPTKENQKSHIFFGKPVMLMDYRLHSGSTNRRGEKYGGYLVVVTDMRGESIDWKSPYKWIFPKLGNLRNVPVGKHFDKSCTRVFPPRPKREY